MFRRYIRNNVRIFFSKRKKRLVFDTTELDALESVPGFNGLLGLLVFQSAAVSRIFIINPMTWAFSCNQFSTHVDSEKIN